MMWIAEVNSNIARIKSTIKAPLLRRMFVLMNATIPPFIGPHLTAN